MVFFLLWLTSEILYIIAADKGVIANSAPAVLVLTILPYRLLTEIDAKLHVALSSTAFLEALYALGFPGPAWVGGARPIHRLVLGLRFTPDL